MTQPGAGETPALPGKTALPGKPWADWLTGVIHFEEGSLEEALACLLRAEQADPRLPTLHLRIGETYLRQKRLDDAERAFQKALDIDGDSPEAHLGLAMVRLRQRRNAEAAEEALLAVSLQHFLPMGHFYLGVALARIALHWLLKHLSLCCPDSSPRTDGWRLYIASRAATSPKQLTTAKSLPSCGGNARRELRNDCHCFRTSALRHFAPDANAGGRRNACPYRRPALGRFR